MNLSAQSYTGGPENCVSRKIDYVFVLCLLGKRSSLADLGHDTAGFDDESTKLSGVCNPSEAA